MTERLNQLALVAHELGGALAPARNAVDLVRSGTAGAIGGDAPHLLDIAARGLARADRILQNLRALAAPETYRGSIEVVDASDLLQRVRAEFAAEAEGRGVGLEVEAAPGIDLPTDPLCLEPILVNLVGNAVKFTGCGGRVTLCAARTRGAVLPGRLSLLAGGFGVQPSFVCFEIRDTGIGLSEEARRRLFEPFYRAPEARARGVPGTGLGLTVARQLVALLHGDLRPTPAAGGGTTFVVTLAADHASRELVRDLDALRADLAARLEEAPQTLLVLRCAAGFESLPAEAFAAALRLRLGDARVVVHRLGTTTWVACAPLGVRPLLYASAALLCARAGDGQLSDLRVHVQRVRRGAGADDSLLQALVRCTRPLPAQAVTRGEVSDAANPARR